MKAKRKPGPASKFRCMVANCSTHKLNKEVSLVVKYPYSSVFWVGDGEAKLQRTIANWITWADFVNYCSVFFLCIPTKQR